MSDNPTKPKRYIVKPNDPPSRGTEVYTHVAWDTIKNKAVAYTSSELTALSYTAQMNERGFIEP